MGLPTLAGTGQAGPASGSSGGGFTLPSLGQQAGGTSATTVAGGDLPTTGTAGATDAGAGAQQQQAAAGGQMPDITALSAKMRWPALGMAIGGAALTVYGFMKGKNLAKYGGISMGLSGLAGTAMGFKASGITTGIEAGKTEAVTILGPQIQQLGAAIDQQNATIQQQAAQIQQLTAGGAGTGQTPGTGTDPGTGQTPGTDGGTGQAPAPAGNAQEIPAGQWSPAALVGQAVTLGAASMPSGQNVAEEGPYVITQPVGATTGYGSLAEADAALRGAMTTNLEGTKNFRWLVVEHDGMWYGMIAQKDQNASPQMPAANGTVAAWHALRAVETGAMKVQWMHYAWVNGQSAFEQVGADGIVPQAAAGSAAPGGAGTPIGGGVAPADQAVTGALTAVGVQPAAGAQPGVDAGTGATTVTGGGQAQTRQSPAAAILGASVQIDAADGVAGGHVQVQKLLDQSINGYSTPGEAASAARLDRQTRIQQDPYERWITVRAADGRFYAFSGQLVNRATRDMGDAGQVAHVFGHGFAEYHDGTAWRAQADSGL